MMYRTKDVNGSFVFSLHLLQTFPKKKKKQKEKYKYIFISFFGVFILVKRYMCLVMSFASAQTLQFSSFPVFIMS